MISNYIPKSNLGTGCKGILGAISYGKSRPSCFAMVSYRKGSLMINCSTHFIVKIGSVEGGFEDEALLPDSQDLLDVLRDVGSAGRGQADNRNLREKVSDNSEKLKFK